jgi:hypothetical protein
MPVCAVPNGMDIKWTKYMVLKSHKSYIRAMGINVMGLKQTGPKTD